MGICHVLGEFRIIDIELIVLIPDKSPMYPFFVGVCLERIEFVLNLTVDVLILARMAQIVSGEGE